MALLALWTGGCAEGPALFEDGAAAAGISFVSYAGDHLWYLIDTLGAGGAAADYDDDGDVDLLLLSGHAILDGYQQEANEHSQSLWRNEGNGNFVDVTRKAGLWNPGWSNGAVFADYDGDGDLDIFVARHGPNLLYRNKGDGTFEEVGVAAGVAHSGWGAGAVFADLDGDQDLDLYVTNYARFVIQEQKGKVDWFDKGVQQFPQYFEPEPNVLYRNNGDGTFTDITEQAGAAADGRSLGALASDVDDDGDLDLFIANDVGFNNLLINDGSGRFTESGLVSGVACNRDGQFEASMGVAAGDYDADGDIDLLVTNYAGEQNTLYRNEGGGLFSDVTAASGLRTKEVLDSVGWGVGMHDFDLDGHIDILAVNGHVLSDFVVWYMRHFYDKEATDIPQMGPDAFRLGAEQAKLLFLGRPDGTFETARSAVEQDRLTHPEARDRATSRFDGRSVGSAIEGPTQGRGAIFADIDGDGRLDVVVTNKNTPAQVLMNRIPPAGNWLELEFRSSSPNTRGVGVRAEVQTANGRLSAELYCGSSYLSSDEPMLHFGLGCAQSVDSIRIRWPDESVQEIRNLKTNRRYRIFRELPDPYMIEPRKNAGEGALASGGSSAGR